MALEKWENQCDVCRDVIESEKPLKKQYKRLGFWREKNCQYWTNAHIQYWLCAHYKHYCSMNLDLSFTEFLRPHFSGALEGPFKIMKDLESLNSSKDNGLVSKISNMINYYLTSAMKNLKAEELK